MRVNFLLLGELSL